MKYECPNCKARWVLTENSHLGGSAFKCTVCNTVSQIPLYCPTCCPPSVAEKQWLETPGGWLGGRRFCCPKGHNFNSLVTRGEAHARLGEFGKEIGQYHQGDRIEAMPPRLKTTVRGGYCAGAVLDWLRRVLQGGKPTLTNAEDLLASTPATAADRAKRDKELRQDVRGATAWVKQSVPEKSRILSQRDKAFLAEIEKHRQESSAQLGAASEKFEKVRAILRSDGTRTREEIDEFLTKARTAYNRATERVRESHDARVKAVNAQRAAPTMERFWPEFSRLMDQFLSEDRATRGLGPSRRPFSQLKVAKSADGRTFDSMEGLINAVLDDTAFEPGRGASVGIYPPNGATGHAIGLCRLNTATHYYLFDPNFGVYELDRGKAREAVLFLFLTAYPYFAGRNTSDNKRYADETGRVGGDYTIFFGAQPSPKYVTHKLPPAQVQSKPVALPPLSGPPKLQTPPSTKNPVLPATKATKPRTPANPPSPTTPQKTSRTVSDLRKKFEKAGT